MKPQHPHFKLRTIKLSYLCYQNPDPFNRTPPKTVPFLRLSGLWLTAAGFHPGQRCKVTVANGALLITAEPPAPEPPGQTQTQTPPLTTPSHSPGTSPGPVPRITRHATAPSTQTVLKRKQFAQRQKISI